MTDCHSQYSPTDKHGCIRAEGNSLRTCPIARTKRQPKHSCRADGDRIGECADSLDLYGRSRRRPSGAPGECGRSRRRAGCRFTVLPLRNSINVGTSKIMSSVFQSCITSPFNTVLMPSAFGFGISSRVTSAGPSGQNVSNVLPRHHCPPPPFFCQSRALTSLAQV